MKKKTQKSLNGPGAAGWIIGGGLLAVAVGAGYYFLVYKNTPSAIQSGGALNKQLQPARTPAPSTTFPGITQGTVQPSLMPTLETLKSKNYITPKGERPSGSRLISLVGNQVKQQDGNWIGQLVSYKPVIINWRKNNGELASWTEV